MKFGIASLSAVLIGLCAFAPSAIAGPIETPIDLKDFFADPTVTVAGDGSSATLAEDPFITPVILSNDPGFGDPNVIIAGPATVLMFDYDFVEPAGNDDEFFAFLLDGSTGLPIGPAFEFLADTTSAGTVSFDLSSLDGQLLGLQFQLSSFDFDLDSMLTISNAKLIDPDPNTGPPTTPPVPEPGTWALFGLAATGAYIARRRRRNSA